MVETLANGYSSESAQQELSNEYQHDRVEMIFQNICVLVLWIKIASVLEGLKATLPVGFNNVFTNIFQILHTYKFC